MKTAVIIIFILMYAVMVAKPQFRTFASLAAALIFCFMGVVPVKEILPAIDFNVLLMIGGTMVVVDYFMDSKMPNLMAEKLLSSSKNVRMVIVLMSLFAGIVSAFIDNVATVLMIAPVGIAICKKLDINPTAMILSIAVSSNLQGAATLVGDTTSIMLGAYADMDFNAFFWLHGKPGIFFAVELGALATVGVMLILFRHETMPVNGGDKIEIKDRFSTVMLFGIVLALIAASFIPNKPRLINGYICCGFAVLSMLIDLIKNHSIDGVSKKLLHIDVDTMVLLAAMFVIIKGVQNVGIIDDAAHFIAKFSNGNVFVLYTIIVWASVLLSAFIDNIPYVATLLPLVQNLSSVLGLSPYLLYFGLLSGATLGGNLTPVGASANIAATGILKREGYTVSLKEFLRIGVPFTLSAVTVGYILIWLVWK